MPETTFLHIRSRDAEPARVVPLPGPSSRGIPPAGFGVGVGPDGEVRLGEGPDSDDARCYLRRRGETWHIHPVGHPPDLSIDGRPVNRQRPLPLGVTFRVGEHWLTLRPAARPAPEWDAVASQVNTRPVEPEPESPAAIGPAGRRRGPHPRRARPAVAVAEPAGAARAVAQGPPGREEVGVALEGRRRPAPPRRPRRGPPRRRRPPRPGRRPPGRPRSRRARSSRPRSGPRRSAQRPRRESPAPSAGRIVARKLGEASRDATPPPTRRGPSRPAPASPVAVAPAAAGRPARGGRADLHPRPAGRESPGGTPGIAGRRRPEPGLHRRRAGLRLGPGPGLCEAVRPAEKAGDAAFVDEWIRTANRVEEAPAKDLPAPEPFVARAPLALDAPTARRRPREPSSSRRRGRHPAAARGRGDRDRGRRGPGAARRTRTLQPGDAGWVLAPPRSRPSRRSARTRPGRAPRVILRSHEAARDAATRSHGPAGPARRGTGLPTPTVARPPATVPIPRPGCPGRSPPRPPRRLGLGSVAASCLWVADDRAAAPTANALLGPAASAVAAADLEPPRTDWWATTGDHMYLAAAANDRARRTPSGSALCSTPPWPRRRCTRRPAWRWRRRNAAERPGSDPGRDLGLSRDAASLAWTARRLIDAGKVEPALRVYHAALELAATADLDRLGRPTYREDSQGKRYLLPHEDAFGPILRDMAGRTGWGETRWHRVVPDHPVAALALARVLREAGKDRGGRPRPAPRHRPGARAGRRPRRRRRAGPGGAGRGPGDAGPLGRGRGLVQAGRPHPAAAAGVRRPPPVVVVQPRRHRPAQARDGGSAREDALKMAKSTDPNDEISRRVIDLLRVEGGDRAAR